MIIVYQIFSMRWNKMSTALIIVDIQNDYFPNGKMELVNPDKAAANAAKVLEWFRKNNKDNIFHVQHIAADPAMGFFLPDTEGAEINEAVQPLENESRSEERRVGKECR